MEFSRETAAADAGLVAGASGLQTGVSVVGVAAGAGATLAMTGAGAAGARLAALASVNRVCSATFACRSFRSSVHRVAHPMAAITAIAAQIDARVFMKHPFFR